MSDFKKSTNKIIEKMGDVLSDKKVIVFSLLSITLVFGIVLVTTQSIFMDFKKMTGFSNNALAVKNVPSTDPQILDMVKAAAGSSIPALIFSIIGLAGVLCVGTTVLRTRQFQNMTQILLTISFVILIISTLSNIIPLYSSYILKERASQAQLDSLHGDAKAVFDLFQVNLSFLIMCSISYTGFKILDRL